MNNMNMAGLNPHVGGPVGGTAAMMMNNTTSMAGQMPQTNRDETIKRFNTYIYDYFIKFDQIDCAKALVAHQLPMYVDAPVKTSPGRRRDGEVNGVDPDSMDTDSKDDYKYPEEMPRPNVPRHCPQSAFIFEWWSLFMEMFAASRKKDNNTPVGAYINQSQVSTSVQVVNRRY